MYAIGNYDGTPPTLTGYLLGRDGRRAKRFDTLAEAEAEAKMLNAMPHAQGRVYAVTAYPQI